MGGVDPGSGVDHLDRDQLALVEHGHRDRAAGRRVADCVADEVGEDLAHPIGVDLQHYPLDGLRPQRDLGSARRAVVSSHRPLDEVAEITAGLPATDRFPFPLACDPKLDSFKAYRAYDDFEGMALHSTALIDADGLLRWQDISYEPFADVEWLLAECQRLLALPAAAGSK